MRISRIELAAAAAAAALSASLVSGAAPASAALQYPFLAEMAGVHLANVFSVAPNDFNNEVFVADSGPNQVQMFGYGGSHVGELTGMSIGSSVNTVAANNSNGQVYVTDYSDRVVDVFDASGKYLSQLTGNSPFGDVGIAVDQANGNVWVNDVCGTLEKYNAAGEYQSTISYEGCAFGVAVDDFTGDLLVPNSNAGTIEIYSQSGKLLETWTGSTTPSGSFGGGNVQVAANNANGDVVVGDVGHKVVDVLNSSGAFLGRITGSPNGGFFEPFGLGVSQSTGDMFVADRNEGTSHVYVYSSSGVVVPDVLVSAPSKITRSSVTLAGSVNPDKIAATYWFEWGTEPSALTHKTSVQQAGEGEAPVSVSAEVTGLSKETTYYYRLGAENANGTNYSDVQSVTTAGAIEGIKTLPTTAVTTTGAVFHGELTPNGDVTECWFEYQGGQMPAPATTPKQNVGSASEVVKVEVQPGILEPNSGYWDRFVCENKQFGSAGGEYTYFQTPEGLPEVVSETAEDVARTHAVLAATVNPENSSVREYFEYGLTSEYGYRTPEMPLSGYSAGEVKARAEAGELESNTVYHFRIVTMNGAGVQVGPDQTFTSGTLTPPVVATGGVSGVSQNGATLEGVVSTEGLVTTYGFEISPNPRSFGPPTGLGSVGAGFNEAPATLVLHGLQPSTTYYYRIVGTNVDGSDEGTVRSFTTLAYPPDEIQVEVLPLLTEPLVAFPPSETPIYVTEAPKPTRCAKGRVRRGAQCVKPKHPKRRKRKRTGKRKR